jgi:hypothetical protein
MAHGTEMSLDREQSSIAVLRNQDEGNSQRCQDIVERLDNSTQPSSRSRNPYIHAPQFSDYHALSCVK